MAKKISYDDMQSCKDLNEFFCQNIKEEKETN